MSALAASHPTLLDLAIDVDRAEVGRLLILGRDDRALVRGQSGSGHQHAGGAGNEEERTERGRGEVGHNVATFWSDFAMRSQ